MKYTNILDLEAQIAVYESEALRLKHILEEIVRKKVSEVL